MGVFSSKLSEASRVGSTKNFEDLGLWTLDDVKILHRRYRKLHGHFGLVRNQFHNLLNFKKPAVKNVDHIFDVLDETHNGRIDGLEFLGGLAATCNGSEEGRTRFLFELCDFNMNGSLCKSEMILMIKCAVIGILKLLEYPLKSLDSVSAFKLLVSEAFERMDNDKNGYLEYSEFLEWARSNRDVMSQLRHFNEKVTQIAESQPPTETAPVLPADESSVSAQDYINECELVPELYSYFYNNKNMAKKEVQASNDEDEADQNINGNSLNNNQFESSQYWKATMAETSEIIPFNQMHGVEAPGCNLELEWIYGYRSYDCRNNIKLNKSKSIIYFAATLGIVYDRDKHSQTFYSNHTGDIVSMAVHPKGAFVATGQLGDTPSIHIWDSTRKEGINNAITILSGFHKQGVTQLAFSNDGRLLASIGMDVDHSIAVYEWETGKLVSSSKGSTAKPLHLTFQPKDDKIVVVGGEFVKFFDITGRCSKESRGLIGKNGHLQNYMSVAILGGNPIVSTQNGKLYWFNKDEELEKVINAHDRSKNRSVTAICSYAGGLITGSNDGTIKFFDTHGKEDSYIIDLTIMNIASDTRVRAITIIEDENILIVGTGSNDILEIQRGKEHPVAKVLLSSHAKKSNNSEARALACHPNEYEFISGTDSGSLRLWSIRRRKQKAVKKLQSGIESIAYSPEGDEVAVGLADGSVNIFDFRLTKTLYSFKHSCLKCPSIRYSPDGKSLAVGSLDGRVYVYNVQKNGPSYTQRAVCVGHTGGIRSLDFSIDGNFIQTNCTSGELFYWNSISCERVKFGTSENKEPKWATWSCLYGWPVNGIHFPDANNDNIINLERCKGGDVIAMTNNTGGVKMTKFPLLNHTYSEKMFLGHAGAVSRVTFTANDRYVLSLGRQDYCLFQWKYESEIKDIVRPPNSEIEKNLKALQEAEAKKLEGKSALHETMAKGAVVTEDTFKAAGGDEFMAVKPFLGAIHEPEAFVHTKSMDDTPDTTLSLEWIYGYSSQDATNNLFFAHSGEVVFFAAAVNVVMDVTSETQRFHRDHTDDILCSALHPNNKIVATGEIGKKPKIIIWDVDTMSTISVFQGFHTRGICQLVFDPSGTKLASVGGDDSYTIVIYDWMKKIPSFTFKGTAGDKTMCMTFDANNKFICGSMRQVTFYTLEGANPKSQKGILGKVKGAVVQPHLCILAWKGYILTGTLDGSIYVWSGCNLVSIKKAHFSKTNSLIILKGGARIASGGKGGTEKEPFSSYCEWEVDDKGQLKLAEDSGNISISNCITSLCVGNPGSEAEKHDWTLIGTDSSEILLSNVKGVSRDKIKPTVLSTIINGHYDGELWGLSTHPVFGNLFATCGDDKTLRIYDSTKKEIKYNNLTKKKSRVVEWGGEMGEYVCLGSQDGSLTLYKFDVELYKDKKDVALEVIGKEVTVGKKGKAAISEIKFSRGKNADFEGKLLMAIGSHDDNIYLFTVDEVNGAVLKTTFKGHSSYITHIDFSTDGKFLQSNSGSYELLLWNIKAGKQEKSSNLKGVWDKDRKIIKDKGKIDKLWNTWTTTLGWPVQGIWPPCADGTDINTTHLNNASSVLVTGDDFGKVNLFRFPCVPKNAHGEAYHGHSSHVTQTRWSRDDHLIISTGGLDRCIFQWKVDNCEVDNEHLDVKKSDGNVRSSDKKKISIVDDVDPFAHKEGGDEFMAVKPWLGAIKEPTGYKHDDKSSQLPARKLEMEWVHGYSNSSYNNVRYVSTGEIVYNAAATGVVYNIENHTQRFHNEHTDDILSLALHPDGLLVATGEQGKKPKILIWDITSGKTVTSISGFHARGVNILAWSNNGEKLASVGMDNDHSIAIYKSDGTMIGNTKGSVNTIFSLSFSPDNNNFVTSCDKSVIFWTIDGRQLTSKKGVYGKKGEAQIHFCSAYIGSDTVTGQQDGSLYLWKDRNVTTSRKGKETKDPSSITSLFKMSTANGGGLLSGSTDGTITWWDATLTPVKKFSLSNPPESILKNISTTIPGNLPLKCSIQSVAASADGTKIVVGTKSADIYEIYISASNLSSSGGDDKKGTNKIDDIDNPSALFSYSLNKLISSHYAGELWAVSWHPTKPIAISGGDDKTIRIWDARNKKQINFKEVDDKVRSIAFSPDGAHIAISLFSGELLVLSSDLKNQICRHQVSKKWCQVLQYSPNGSSLAIGSHDTKIYLLNTTDYSRTGLCSAHSSYITHLDWSTDGKYLQSNCGAYELLFWDAKTGKQIKSAASLRDVKWFTWTCVLGFPVQGIWPPGDKGTDINGAVRSRKGGEIVTVDDMSCVKMFNYPCVDEGAKFRLYRGHSSHVTNFSFSNEDEYGVSAGGLDRCLFQYKITNDK